MTVVKLSDLGVLDAKVPDILVTDVSQVELVGQGTCVSALCCTQRGGLLIPQVMLTVPYLLAPQLARGYLSALAEFHNLTQFSQTSKKTAHH